MSFLCIRSILMLNLKLIGQLSLAHIARSLELAILRANHSCILCPSCTSVSVLYIMYMWLFSVSAIQAQITGRETMGEYVKFTAVVQNIYKRDNKIRRGEVELWVQSQDLACKCPKVRLHRVYLILGKDIKAPGKSNGIILDRRSIVVPWKDAWDRRLRKLQKQGNGSC